MEIKTKEHSFIKRTQPQVFLITLIAEKHVSWSFCMTILTQIFHRSDEESQRITEDIQTNGEGICGAYIFEIAETKAVAVETHAKKENFTLRCLLEEI